MTHFVRTVGGSYINAANIYKFAVMVENNRLGSEDRYFIGAYVQGHSDVTPIKYFDGTNAKLMAFYELDKMMTNINEGGSK